MNKELAQKALDALLGKTPVSHKQQVIDELLTEIAKPDADPVAFMNPDPEIDQVVTARIRPLFEHYIRDCTIPLYTTPQDQPARIAELEQQLAELKNRKPVFPSDDFIANFSTDDHEYLDDTIKAVWISALIANGIKVGDDE